MTLEINLHAKPYASHLDQGYNAKREVYDIEVLNAPKVFNAWEVYLRDNHDLGPWDEATVPLFKEWCNTNNVYYYAAGDDFSEYVALDAAANACATFLLMEGF